MKKIIILVLVVLGAAALPIIGQKITQAKLDSKMDELQTYGLSVKNPSTNSSYLNTSKHYEFVLEDSDKFIQYIGTLTGDKLPTYSKSLFDGVVIGADISYSNLAFASDVKLDIYPMKLPEKAADDLLAHDVNMYTFVEDLLKTKAFLYHINYNLATKDFDGYIKDIDEEFIDKNAEVVRFKILGVTYVGNGSLLKPQSVKAHAKTIELIAKADGKKAVFTLSNLNTDTDFKTQTTYTTSMDLDSMVLDIDGNYAFKGSMNDLKFIMSSNTESAKAIFDAKFSMKNVTIDAPQGAVKLEDFNYDITLKDIDKDSFEKLRVVIANADTMEEPELQAKLSKGMGDIFSKGLTLELKDFSLKEIELYNQKSAAGFTLKSDIVLKADPEFAQKMKKFPLLLANNLTIDTNFRISKALFLLLNQQVPLSVMAGGLAKDDGDSYVFDIKLLNSKFSVNGKQL